jgi:hypothetical protein
MAIKGKTKSRSNRPVARAPRREPVVLKPPLFRRRWVQVLGAALLGAFAVVMVVWVTNGLRDQREERDAAQAAADRRAAAQTWQVTVEGELAKSGTLQPGIPPTLFAPLSTVIDGLVQGEPPEETEDALADAVSQAKASAKTLSEFDLTGTISDQGFQLAQTNYLLDSRDDVVRALTLFQRAAQVAQLAAAAEGDEQVALAEQAAALRDEANGALVSGWTDLQQVLFAVGLAQPPADPGVPGLGDITGAS